MCRCVFVGNIRYLPGNELLFWMNRHCCLLRNTLRVTRSAALSSQDGSVGGSVYLGKKGKDFEFSQLQMRVEFLECSSGEGRDADIANLEKSLARL